MNFKVAKFPFVIPKIKNHQTPIIMNGYSSLFALLTSYIGVDTISAIGNHLTTSPTEIGTLVDLILKAVFSVIAIVMFWKHKQNPTANAAQ